MVCLHIGLLSRITPLSPRLRDFDAPKPCPYDASAGTIAARGMQMLYQLLLETDKAAAERYLAAGFKLIDHILRECGTPAATLSGGKVDWGKDEWETLLMVSGAELCIFWLS